MKILIALMLCFPVFSSTIQKFNGVKTQNIILSYEENGSFFVDHIQVPKGELQNLILRKIFLNKKDRDTFKKSYISSKHFVNLKSEQFENVESETKRAVLWTPKNEWDLEWEKAFSKWVELEFNEDFFIKYNLSTDCADVAFALRWIYARINSLPVANTLAGSHIIFSHESMKKEWLNLKRADNWYEDELFTTALNYLMKHVYTGTLNIDGYPIELSKETFLVGTIHLDGGHTMIISKIDYNQIEAAPIWKLSSTVPAKVRKLFEEVMVDSSMTGRDYGGLFRMRWPVFKNGKWSLIDKDKMPLYSLEQYEDEFLDGENSFTIALIKRLGISFDPKRLVIKTISSIKNMLNQRIAVVNLGHNFCKVNDCSEGTFNYEEHSTPTRDKRITAAFKTGRDLAQNLSSFDPHLPSLFEKNLSSETFEVLGTVKSLKTYEQMFNHYTLSNHPDDSIEERWATSGAAMLTSLEKRFISFLGKRDDLIALSHFCTPSNCAEGTQNFKDFNTYKFDSQNRHKLLLASSYIQEQFNINFSNKALNQKMKKLPYFLSAPYLESRSGEQVQDLTKDKVVKAKKIIEIDKNHLLVERSFVDMTTNKRVTLAPQMKILLVNRLLGFVIVQDKKTIILMNKYGGVMDQLTLKYGSMNLNSIGSTHLALTDQSTDTYESEINIYDVTALKFDQTVNLGQSSSYGSDLDVGQYIITKNEDSVFSNRSGLFYNVYYTDNGVLKIHQIESTQYVTTKRKGNSLYYLDENENLNVFNFTNSTACKIKVEEVSYINEILSNGYIGISSEQGERQTLYKLNGCSLEEVYTSTNYFDLYETQGNILIEDYLDSKTNYFLFDGVDLNNLNPKEDVSLYSFDGYFSSWVKADEKGVQDYFQLDVSSNVRIDLDKTKLTTSCKVSIPSRPNCGTSTDALDIFYFTESEGFRYFRQGQTTIANTYKDYSLDDSSAYFETAFELDHWDYFQIESGLVILRERI